jgi:rhodanese-related sulfurtransferase/uncharacterized membrane protein YedE/YeeE
MQLHGLSESFGIKENKMAPLDILGTFGKAAGYITALVIGLGFGAALELSGFGDSRKLAGQFYFKDMTVLKVMFTAIIVAMTLIFLTSSVGLMDFQKVFVNPTYMVPGIIGGLIMGVGFIVGGFCPGTSLVSASTGKIDGMFFLGGVTFGVFLFGESVASISDFHNSSFMGRFTLDELFGLNKGLVVVLVLLMAYGMFYGSELLEQHFGDNKPWKEIDYSPFKKKVVIGGLILLFLGVLTMAIGQPNSEERWNSIKAIEQPKIDKREVFSHPGEVLSIMNDSMIYCKLIDVRLESDFNLFHLEDSINKSLDGLKDNTFIKKMKNFQSNTVIFVMSNDEKNAVEAYKILKANNILNVYILEGGINKWISTFKIDPSVAVAMNDRKKDDTLGYNFDHAVGSTIRISNPLRGYSPENNHGIPQLKFTRKVKVKKKKAISGGCG